MSLTTTTVAPTPGVLARFHAAVTLDEHDLDSLRRVAIVGLVILNIFDILLTRRALALGATEANPLMAPFVQSGWGIAIKAALPIALGFRHLRAPLERRLVLGLCWVSVLYLGVVTWNFHMLSQPHLLG